MKFHLEPRVKQFCSFKNHNRQILLIFKVLKIFKIKIDIVNTQQTYKMLAEPQKVYEMTQ